MDLKTFEEKKIEIEKMPKIYLEDFKVPIKRTSLKTFINNFINEYNMTHNTLFVKDNTIQTRQSKHRSSGDIYKICKFYFPNKSFKLETIMRILYELIQEKQIITQYCYGVGKRVFLYYNPYFRNYQIKKELDEYGLTFNDWESI